MFLLTKGIIVLEDIPMLKSDQIHVTKESTEDLKCRSVKNVIQEEYQTQINLIVVSRILVYLQTKMYSIRISTDLNLLI